MGGKDGTETKTLRIILMNKKVIILNLIICKEPNKLPMFLTSGSNSLSGDYSDRLILRGAGCGDMRRNDQRWLLKTGKLVAIIT